MTHRRPRRRGDRRQRPRRTAPSATAGRLRGCTSSCVVALVWLFPLALGGAQLASATTTTRRRRLHLVRRLHLRRTTPTPGSRPTSPTLPQLAVHHRARGAADAVPRVVVGVRPGAVPLQVQPGAAGCSPRRNLLPPQACSSRCTGVPRIPLPYWFSDSARCYDSYWGLILVNIAFQTGFCAFVLSNYMKTLPRELNEAAQVDGAALRQYWQITLPLCRPAAGGARDARGHLDLQRVLLGDGAVQRRQVAGHQLAEQPAAASSSPTTTSSPPAR